MIPDKALATKAMYKGSMTAKKRAVDDLALADEPSVVPGQHTKTAGDAYVNAPPSVAGGCAVPLGGKRPADSIQRGGVAPIGAADLVSAPEWPEVAAWAKTNSNRIVGLYLFGSRMRGDHGPESDLDIAIVIRRGARVQTGDLPESIAGIAVDWVPLSFERVCAGLHRMGVPWIIASRGIRLWGQALPPVDRTLEEGTTMRNIEEARHNLLESLRWIRDSLASTLDRCALSPSGDVSASTAVSTRSASAGEMACKAVVALRGLEPTRSHSVEQLCAVIRRHDPDDPLLPLIERLNGATAAVHTARYFDLRFSEPFSASIARVASAMDAVTAIAGEMKGYPDENPLNPDEQRELRSIVGQIRTDADQMGTHAAFGHWFKDRAPQMQTTIGLVFAGMQTDRERDR